jgi:O-antigen/teichoic acid export membrane protein/tRNA A-37 threonylcarbamoyl transferase component Bud32
MSKVQGQEPGLWTNLLGTVASAHILALADQLVVSGTSFLTTLIIGRFTQPSELGLYSMGLSLLASCLCVQEALISTPYAVQRHHSPGTPAERAGTLLAQTGVLAAVAAAALTVTGCGLAAAGARDQLVVLFWGLTAVAPFLILREFARRFAFAHLRVAQALVLDTAGAVIQLMALVFLGWTGQMSAVNAYAALGIAGALTSLVWLYIARASFTVCADQILGGTKESWSLGRWLFANQLVLTVQASLVYWLLASLGSMTATGIYAACMSIALFSNPLILGASNLLTPSSALAWKEGGGKRLRRESVQASLGLALVMALFCMAVALFGDVAMHFLYPGEDYTGQGHTVTVLALGMLVMAVGIPAISALTSMERPRVIFWTTLWAAAVTVALTLSLMPKWGLVGTAYGVLAGNLVRTAARWVALLSFVSRTGPKAGLGTIGAALIPAEIFLVLQQMTRARNFSDWVIEQLDQGLQADIYAVRCADCRRPVWQSYGNVAIKLYKPGASPGIVLARCQCESLSWLHTALNGSNVYGWKISVPAPLYICASPAALVMSMVPGKTLSFWLGRDDVSPDVLHSLAYAVIAAVNRSWTSGHLHGDLTFDNILCDIEARHISFVDAGIRTICPFRDDVANRWDPPSHDLAHMLYDVGVSVITTIRHPIASRRKQVFAENLVRAFIETIGSPEERQSQLGEIQSCARVHLMVRERVSRSLHNLYAGFQTRVGLRRIDKMISRVQAKVGHSRIPSPGCDFHRVSCAIPERD